MSQVENIQKKSRGGARPGAGRKKGTCNAKTRDIANKAIESGITPLEYLLQVMRDEQEDKKDRLDAAKSAAPYIHPRLSAVEVTGDEDNPVRTVMQIKLIDLTSE